MVLGATALTVTVIATVIFLRASGSPPAAPGPSHVIPQPSPAFPDYSVVPINATTAFVVVGSRSTSSPVFYTTVDAGTVWRRVSDPIPKSELLASARLLADGALFLETWDRTDQRQTHAYVGDGATWTEVHQPQLGGGWPRMLNSRVGFYFVSGQAISTNQHDLAIFRTLDSGNHWDRMLQLDAGHPNAGGLSISEEHSTWFTDATQGWLVSTAQPYAIVCGRTGWTPAGRLLASEDGGQHWSERRLQPLPDGSAQLGPSLIVRGSAGYMLARVQPYVGRCPPEPVEYAYATLDGGLTWSPPRRLPTESFFTLDGVDWWATDGKRLLRSRDQGVSWTAAVARLPASNGMLDGLYPVGGDNAWSFWVSAVNQTARAALLRTTDGGANWTEVKLPPVI